MEHEQTICTCPYKIDGISIKIYRKNACKLSTWLGVFHVIIRECGATAALSFDRYKLAKAEPPRKDTCVIDMPVDLRTGVGKSPYIVISIDGMPNIESVTVYGYFGYESHIVGWWVALCDNDVIVEEKQIDAAKFTLSV